MKYFFEFLPFMLLGVFLGKGPYNVFDWEWWVMDAVLIITLLIRDKVKIP